MNKVTYKEVQIEAILKGVYIKVVAEGRPIDIINDLLESDPDAKFKDSFPVYGKSGGGAKQTKDAKIITISIKTNNGNKFIDLGCSCDEGDQSIAVSKKKVDEFVSGMKERLQGHQEDFDKQTALIMIRNDEDLVPIKYFEIDGKCYFDSFGG